MSWNAVRLCLLASLVAVAATAASVPLTTEQAAELARIQANIERLGLPWQAGDNPVFRWSPAERGRRNGSPAPAGWRGPVHGDLPRDIPLTLDWRANGGNWITPIRNQADCGSCWTFWAVAAMESWLMIRSGESGQQRLDLAEQYVLSCIPSGTCAGGWCQNALDFLITEGICDEACFPYEADDRIPCADACGDVFSRLVYLGDHAQVTFGTIDVAAINLALQDGPLVTNFTVFEDFYAYDGGIYVWDGTSHADGGHSVIIIGYDHGRRAWLAKNSWGVDFGEFGYFWIAYDSGTGFGSETWRLLDANQRPELTDAGCEPAVAAPGDRVTWTVTYRDAEGDEPVTAVLVLREPNGRLTEHDLDAGAGDLVTGRPYTVRLALAEAGQYGSRFRFQNEAGQDAAWPASGYAAWPRVETATGTPPAGVTKLHEPAPNPANPGTVVSYVLARDGVVDLDVYDLSGRLVGRLGGGWHSAGIQRVYWDGRDVAGRAVPSGTYLVRMRADGATFTRKLSLVQ